VRETLEARRTLTATQTPLNEWSVHLVELYAAHAAEVDEQIATNAHDWPLRRMPAVDRALLRLGGAEILHDTAKEDIGPVIGDYVTITRALSTDQSPRFVEGVLQSLSAIRDLLG
jgi:N utilization substance protein B